MTDQYWSAADAKRHVGRFFVATKGYSGVEAGTLGYVVGTYNSVGRGGVNATGLDVLWLTKAPLETLLRLGQHRGTGILVDGFSRSDLEYIDDEGPDMVPVDGLSATLRGVARTALAVATDTVKHASSREAAVAELQDLEPKFIVTSYFDEAWYE